MIIVEVVINVAKFVSRLAIAAFTPNARVWNACAVEVWKADWCC